MNSNEALLAGEEMVTFATTAEEALQGHGEFRAGGTDVSARRRLGISRGPLVDIRALAGCQAISLAKDGSAVVGAMVTLQELADHPVVIERYPGLARLAGRAANPQIRAMATLGGSLLQRTRCAYYRHPAFDCFKKGGEGCPARDGHHADGVLFDLGPCVQPHPSTTGAALLAYEALYVTHGHEARPLAELYGDGSETTADHTLAAGELLTQVILPPPVEGARAAYFRATGRALAEWPIVEAMVRLRVVDGRIDFARVAVGGVANIPLRLNGVEEALVGQAADGETLVIAAGLATEGINPLPQAAYKAEFLVGVVLEALERAV